MTQLAKVDLVACIAAAIVAFAAVVVSLAYHINKESEYRYLQYVNEHKDLKERQIWRIKVTWNRLLQRQNIELIEYLGDMPEPKFPARQYDGDLI